MLRSVAVAASACVALGCGEDGGFKVGALGEIELRPGALEILSDGVAPDASRGYVVDVANTGTGTVVIGAVSLVPADAPSALLPNPLALALGALPATPLTLEPGATAPLALTYTRLDDEPRAYTVSLALDGARAATALLPVSVLRGEARLMANPTNARFEAGSDVASLTLTVLNVGTRTLWLDRMVLRGDASFAATLGDERVSDAAREVVFVPKLALEPGTSRPVVVDFLRTSPTPVAGELVLYGDAPNTRDGFVIPLLGNDTEPCVLARPPLVSFGEKSPDTLNDIGIEIENCGSGPADVASIALSTAADGADPLVAALGVDGASSPRFALRFDGAAPEDAAPWTLAPGETRRLDVRYTSAASGEVPAGEVASDTGFVLVRSDARLPLRVVKVTGATRGELPPSRCELTELAAVPVDEACLGLPRPGELEPAVRWERSTFAVSPVHSNVMMTPVVGNLTDDNGDGRIDASDIADVVITRFANGGYSAAGVLTALSGDDGRELWSLTTVGSTAPYGIGGVALGDLDANGRPEICVHRLDNSLACLEVPAPGGATPASLAPTLRFEVAGCAPAPVLALGIYPAIADLDADGRAEVMFDGCVVDADGVVVAKLPAGLRSTVAPFAANIDDDAPLEIVDGGAVYDSPVVSPAPATPATLVVLHDLGMAEARTAIGDFDHDGRPEIVATHWWTKTLRLYDPDGATDADTSDGWQVSVPASNSPDAGGPPTIADFDGDGELEIGVASELAYVAFDSDGTVLWTQPSIDQSSRQTGSSVFDFDGDGAAEVLYADEENLRIFDGATGAVRFVVAEHGSGTGVEYPVIADVNHDGRADIVLASNNYYRGPWNGVHMLTARDDTWSSAPPVWNQHAYNVINIAPDLSVPRTQRARYDSFRAAEWADPTARPDADLQLAAVDLCPSACADDGTVESARVHFQIGNGGMLPAAGSLQLREGSAIGPVVAMSVVPEIGSGEVLAFEMSVPRAVWGERVLVAVVSASGGAFDCRGDNDVRTLGPWPWSTPLQCP